MIWVVTILLSTILLGSIGVFAQTTPSGVQEDKQNVLADFIDISNHVEYRVFTPTVPYMNILNSDCAKLSQDTNSGSNYWLASQDCLSGVQSFITGASLDSSSNPQLVYKYIDTAFSDFNVSLRLLNSTYQP